MEDIKDLDRDVILKAISKIKNNPEKRNGRESTTYDLVHKGEAFPPILVLSEANRLAGGEELTLSDFNNSTEQAFSILRKFGLKVIKKNDLSRNESILKSRLSALGYENTSKFFECTAKIVYDLNLKQGDSRVVYSVRNDHERLAFTIGQRYCLTLQTNQDKSWGFITSSKEIYSTSVDISEYDGPVKAFWNKTESFKIVEESLDEVEKACTAELERTTKSGYLKFNNSSFERAVFNEKYREKIFMEVFNKSIQNKPEPFLDTLQKFLDQSKTDNLTYSHYQKSYNELKVRVSFGKGNAARIPWISFLYGSQTTNEGIYPVYLLYKKRNLLILAYGVSEENEPARNWPLENPKTIKEYFKDNELDSPQRYGESYVFKVYNLENSLEDYSIDSDLYEITNFYKEVIKSPTPVRSGIDINIEVLFNDLIATNLIFDKNLVRRFTSSLTSKPFLILTGLSGSGKTKLAQAFAKWIIEEDKQLNLVPVGADWTNREPLLGYPNALEEGKYVLPESGVLQLILRAKNDPGQPYFLILDEMNLSHVERYFADFLSAIESKEEISLHSGEHSWDANGYEVPPSLFIPKNLFIIGTVNIDETTYMFSPKVLDRANVIEFRVSHKELAQFLENPAAVDLDMLRNQGASMAKDFVNKAKDNGYSYSQKETLSEELLKFFDELNTVGAEFGYRSAYEIQRFASLAEQLAKDWEFEQIMDAAIAQKLLPKLHGSRRKLEKILFRLGDLCYPELEKGCDDLFKKHDNITEKVIKQAKYPISFEKIVRMHKGLVENGFTSFAEA